METDSFLSSLWSSMNSRVFCDVASSQLICIQRGFDTTFFPHLHVPSILIRRIVDCLFPEDREGNRSCNKTNEMH